MDFPISGEHIQPLYLVLVGVIVGALGGFFGVGGSFLAGPALFAMGVPMNFVVGTDLAHIVGKSVVAAKQHRAFGNIDFKFAMFMIPGTIGGVETGAQLIEFLKKRANVDLPVAFAFIAVLLSISGFMAWESWLTLRKLKTRAGKAATAAKKDVSVMSGTMRRIQKINLPPMVSLPVSGIKRISVWAIVVVGFFGGFFGGFLGGGAGYIRMPAMVYLLGLPTHIAVGTDLFEIIISAGWGTISHGMKGNVDIMIALVMHTGAAIGAQLGAYATQYFAGPRIRLAFVPLPLMGIAVIVYGLISGHHLK
jgi:uncharacterized membrane protein YfcA